MAPFAPIFQLFWFSKDYWRPEYIAFISINGTPVGIEEPLFAFFIGGIGTVIYEIFRKRKHQTAKPRPVMAFSLLAVAILVFICLKFTNLNSIWASVITLILGVVFMLMIDEDLIYDAAFSGVSFVIIAFVIYFPLLAIDQHMFERMWVEGGLSGIEILFIPIEEIIWFLSCGLFAGAFYEFWINVKTYPKLRK